MSLPCVIGVTGKSGGGKSTVCAFLAEQGYAVVDGDAVSREVQTKGTACFDELVAEFSSVILDENGEIDRRRLGKICFSDKAKLARLNEICHPHILNRINELIPSHSLACFIEAGALYESGFNTRCDRVIAVLCGEEQSVERIMERDGISREYALSRLASQYPTEKLIELADCVIINDGSLDKLRDRVYSLNDTINYWVKEVM